MGLKFRVTVWGIVIADVLKSDHIGIEISTWQRNNRNRSILKSDHIGIEIWSGVGTGGCWQTKIRPYWDWNTSRRLYFFSVFKLKSDHIGIEISNHQNRFRSIKRLKSDHIGIEIIVRTLFVERCYMTKIRPYWDWNVKPSLMEL